MKLRLSLLCAIALFAIIPSSLAASQTVAIIGEAGNVNSMLSIRGGSKSNEMSPKEKASFGYPEKSWGWMRAKPKTSLQDVQLWRKEPYDQSKSAEAWVLNLVELVHYGPFIPGALACYSVFKNAALWAKLLPGKYSDIRVLLLLLNPIIATMGGLPGFTMHTYEGWQVTPFVNPLLESVNNYDNNNAWLREVAYKYIFVTQYAALCVFCIAVFGVSNLSVGLSMLGLASSFIGNQEWKTTFMIFNQPSFPLGIFVFVPFLIAAILNLYATYKLFITNPGLAFLGFIPMLAPILNAFGGAFEGIVAETRFNQWLHIIAVLGFNASMWILWYLFEQVDKML